MFSNKNIKLYQLSIKFKFFKHISEFLNQILLDLFWVETMYIYYPILGYKFLILEICLFNELLLYFVNTLIWYKSEFIK